MIDQVANESSLRTACLWEAAARKAGNVHPQASFADLTYDDFVLSANAIAPVLARLVSAPLGSTILEAIRATRAVVRTNTNLGIVLLLAPLSKCDGDWSQSLKTILNATTVDDSIHVYEAIRRAIPGGLGEVVNEDVANTPTLPLRDVMALAADRDLIARQYANNFSEVLDEGVPALVTGWEKFGRVEAAILHAQLHLLSRFPDTLIARKRGEEEARAISRQASAIDLTTAGGREQYREFDRYLRADGHARNPGATADLIAACLFVALREHRMVLSMPFTWEEYG